VQANASEMPPARMPPALVPMSRPSARSLALRIEELLRAREAHAGLLTRVAPVPYRALVVFTRRPTRLLNLM
jgi:hypothetical protein